MGQAGDTVQLDWCMCVLRRFVFVLFGPRPLGSEQLLDVKQIIEKQLPYTDARLRLFKTSGQKERERHAATVGSVVYACACVHTRMYTCVCMCNYM